MSNNMKQLKNNPFYQLSKSMSETEVFLISEFGEQGIFTLKDVLSIIFFWYVKDIKENYMPIDTTISDYIKENYSIFIRVI